MGSTRATARGIQVQLSGISPFVPASFGHNDLLSDEGLSVMELFQRNVKSLYVLIYGRCGVSSFFSDWKNALNKNICSFICSIEILRPIAKYFFVDR